MSQSANMANLTTYGMYNYDNSLFEHMNVPESVDKDAVIAYILLTSDGLEVLYPNFDTMKEMIKFWSIAESPIWNKLYTTYNLEYNPLENYDVHDDRAEDYTKDETDSVTEHENADINNTKHGNDKTGKTTHDSGKIDDTIHNSESTDIVAHDSSTGSQTETGSENTTHSVAAFNATTMQNANADNTSTSNSTSNSANKWSTNNEDSNQWRTDNQTHDSWSKDDIETDKWNTENENKNRWNTYNRGVDRDDYTHTVSHTHGNMGSYSYQELIKQEAEVNEFNIYQYIADSYKRRFCLLVY